MIAKYPGVDHTSLKELDTFAEYICRKCISLLQKYNCVLRDLKSKLTAAFSILPKFAVLYQPLTSALQEASSQSSMFSASPLASSTVSPEVTVRLKRFVGYSFKIMCAIILLHAKIHYHSRPRVYTITQKRRKLFKPLVHTSYNSFATECVKRNKMSKAAIIRILGQVLKSETAAINSDKV